MNAQVIQPLERGSGRGPNFLRLMRAILFVEWVYLVYN